MPGEETENSVTGIQANLAADTCRAAILLQQCSVATGGFAFTQRLARTDIALRTDVQICRRTAMARCRRASGHAQSRTSMALTVHILEAATSSSSRVLLLPHAGLQLAQVMLPLAAAGSVA
jgi:hypothetical protein